MTIWIRLHFQESLVRSNKDKRVVILCRQETPTLINNFIVELETTKECVCFTLAFLLSLKTVKNYFQAM